MNHFLTFILPCYNYADIIEQSLDSIYQQNLKIPFEVIATDDVSPDERTREILRKWDKKYDNFHAYFHTENKNEGGTCNTCISHSKGDLFFCLDTDNVLAPNSMNALIELLDETGCEGACFEELKFFKEIDGKYVQINSWIYKAPDNIIDLSHIIRTSETPASSGNYLFTKKSYEKAGSYPEHNCMGSWGFGFRQLATGSKIVILPNSFYWHRYSEGGMYLINFHEGKIAEAVKRVVMEFIDILNEENIKTLENKYGFSI